MVLQVRLLIINHSSYRFQAILRFHITQKNACVHFSQLTDSPKEYGIAECPAWCKLEGWMLLMLDIHCSSQTANSVSGPAGWVKLLFKGNRKRLKCNHWCVIMDGIKRLAQLISLMPCTYKNCNMPQWPKTLIRTLCKWLFTCKILPIITNCLLFNSFYLQKTSKTT